MIYFLIFLVVAFSVIFAILSTKKSPKHLFAEIKYELIYNVLGAKALLSDILNKRRNKIELPNKSGQVAVVTGGARGIGALVVKMLMQCDMHVIVGCRNLLAGEKLREEIRKNGVQSGAMTCFQLDVGSMESVRSFAKLVSDAAPKVHVLVNNAGIMFGPYRESVNGFESQLAVNYLGHFLLTHLLLSSLKAAGTNSDTKARVVNVTSCAHLVGSIYLQDIHMRAQYIAAAAYAQSKLAQVLFTKYLDEVFKCSGVPVGMYAVHPGIVNTDLFDGTPLKTVLPWLPGLIFKTPAEGAIPVVYACVSPKVEERSGSYISNCRIEPANPQAESPQLQKALYDFTINLLKMDDLAIHSSA